MPDAGGAMRLVGQRLLRFLNARLTFWALLALLAIFMMAHVASGRLGYVIQDSGTWAARFFIVTMSLTPLMMLFPKSRVMRWLVKRRRPLGVAVFLYALLHFISYLIREPNLTIVAIDFWRIEIFLAWMAFVLLAVLAITSNEWSLRRLGPRWKSLQRLSYLAGGLALAHWLLTKLDDKIVWLQVAPLIALQVYRIARGLRRRRAGAS